MKNIEKKGVWTEEFKIHSYEMDARGKASLPLLSKFMQETAYHHAENLGFGFSHLMENNLFWVLANQKISIKSYPGWGDNVTIHTWPSGRTRLSYFRDFKIFDGNSDIIGLATTTWFAIDMERHRPRNLDDYFEFNPVNGETVFPERPEKLKFDNTFKKSKTFQAGYNDLDINDHVNNVRYIEWILESFPLAHHKSNFLQGLEINYLAEAIYDDSVSAFIDEAGNNTFKHSIIRNNDNKELCKAKTVWI